MSTKALNTKNSFSCCQGNKIIDFVPHSKSIHEIITVNQVFYFRPKFSQKGILGSNFIKLVTDSNSAPSNYVRYEVVAEIDKFLIFGLNLPKRHLWVEFHKIGNGLKFSTIELCQVVEIREGPLFLKGPVYKVCRIWPVTSFTHFKHFRNCWGHWNFLPSARRNFISFSK